MVSHRSLIGGRYELIVKIGQGKKATVHKALDKKTKKVVSLKLLGEGCVDAPERRLRELQKLSSSENPNIAKVLDIGEDGSFVAMELLEGQTLQDLLKVQSELPWARIKPILEQVCDALKAYHDAGMMHLDVKPGNIFLTEGEKVKVLNSGLAKFVGNDVDDQLTDTGTIFGTFKYMSPERMSGEYHMIDLRSDVYALGVVAYQMLCGVVPFQGTDLLEIIQMIKNQVPVLPSVRRPELGIPFAAEALVMKALEKDPVLRFQDMEEMGQAIRKA